MEDNQNSSFDPNRQVNPTPMPPQPPVTPPVQPVMPPQPAAPAGPDQLSSEDKIFASLSYVSILFLVPLILRREQPSVYFHARQGLVLFGAEVVIWFLLFLLESFIAALAPASSLSLVAILGMLAWIAFVAISIAAIYFVFRGRQWEIPFLGKIAKKIQV